MSIIGLVDNQQRGLDRGENYIVAENSHARKIIPWTLKRFTGQKMILTTSFRMEGCALIDMYSKALYESDDDRALDVVYLDTMFFFPETYELRDRMIERYPNMNFVNRGTNLTPEQQAKKYGKNLWEHNPDLCCKLRKVDPMIEVMKDVEVWITGLRKSQSPLRESMRKVEWDWRYQALKINPLADWSRENVWEYVKAHGVPYNRLHEQGYPSIGCVHCTISVPGTTPSDYTRAGRWAGTKKQAGDCGLHGGPGI